MQYSSEEPPLAFLHLVRSQDLLLGSFILLSGKVIIEHHLCDDLINICLFFMLAVIFLSGPFSIQTITMSPANFLIANSPYYPSEVLYS